MKTHLLANACIALTIGLLSFGCSSSQKTENKSKTDATLTAIEAELRNSEGKFKKAIADDLSSDPKELLKQIAELQALSANNEDIAKRMVKLLKKPFPQKEKSRLDQIQGEIDERQDQISEKITTLREAVATIKKKEKEK